MRISPFGKPDAALLASVVVPLNEASHERSASIVGLDLPETDKEKSALDSHASGGSMSIDILRAEVERDAAVDDHQSAYDRT